MRGAVRRNATALLALAVSLAGCTGIARALTDEEIFRNLPFNYVPAGARAAAMGGAYVAIADDGSAALTNPAGLQALSRGQFFIEFRSLSPKEPDSIRNNVGSLSVDPVTGDRNLPYLSLTTGSEQDNQNDISFVSFAWPFDFAGGKQHLRVGGSWQLGASQDLTLPSSGNGTKAVFSFDSFPNTVSGGEVVAYSVAAPVTGKSSTEIVYLNGTVAYDVHPDFSVGLTVSQVSLDLKADTTTRVDDPLQLYLDPSHPRLPSQPTTDFYETHIDGADSAITYTVGLHWHPGSAFSTGASPWQFGAVFQKGASFSVRETTVLNQQPDQSFDNEIHLPDRYGVGASYRYQTRWLFALEVDRLQLSTLDNGFHSGVNFLTSDTVSGSFGIDPKKKVEFESKDGYVERIGAEYAMPLRNQYGMLLAFRGGYFRSPDDRIRMTSFNSQDPAVNAMYKDSFPPGESLDHFTAGVGVAWRSQFVHLSAETSDRGTQVSANYVVNFGQKH
jgi:long-subunit fatty acid transport protein